MRDVPARRGHVCLRVIGLLLAVVCSSRGVQAQALAPIHTQSQTVIITANAPIFLNPDNGRTPLRVASAGSRLGLVRTEGEFYYVEFRDPQYGDRYGYVEKRFARISEPDLQPMDLSISSPSRNEPATAAVAVDREPPQRQVPSTQDTTPKPHSRHRREGFWFNVGLGEGWLGCDDCAGERASGLSGGLVLGGTITPRVLLGVGTTGWAKSVLGETLSAGTLDLRLRFYPSTNSGFFITGGIGAGTVRFAGESEVGAGAVLGLGIDLRVGSNVSITPFWNGFAMRSSTVDANVGQIGLGITVH